MSRLVQDSALQTAIAQSSAVKDLDAETIGNDLNIPKQAPTIPSFEFENFSESIPTEEE